MSTREPPTISLIQQVNTLPPVPTYEQSEYELSHPHKEGQDGTWLEGTFKVHRIVKLCYNPHPTGGINSLEESSAGEVPGMGGYELMFRAPVVRPLPPHRLRFMPPTFSLPLYSFKSLAPPRSSRHFATREYETKD